MEAVSRPDSYTARKHNEAVEAERKAYHERRCAEDETYRIIYQRMQERMERIAKAADAANALLFQAIRGEQPHIDPEATDIRPIILPKENEVPECLKGLDHFGLGIIAVLFGDDIFGPELTEEGKRATEEIARVNHEFDSRLIYLSGFEW